MSKGCHFCNALLGIDLELDVERYEPGMGNSRSREISRFNARGDETCILPLPPLTLRQRRLELLCLAPVKVWKQS